MARFDVYRNPISDSDARYFVDIQSDLMSDLRTRVVIPLVPLPVFGTPVSRLNPVVAIEGQLHALATTDMAGVHVTALGESVGSLESHADDITNAVDFLLYGF
jgi:toxin CcdB